MTRQEEADFIYDYRQKLIEYGRKVMFENPDRLSPAEVDALTQKVLTEINSLDVAAGLPSHKMDFRPHGVPESRVHELYLDFLDWYDIVKSPATALYDYVRLSYPKDKYRKILCVGDGENCHVGRKLAALGYDVVSVDPEARKEFSMPRKVKGGGRLHVVRAEFFNSSENMIDWADLIIGPKVPQCAESFIGLKKEAVFTISKNPEIHDFRFKGVPVTSEKVLVDQIRKCKGVVTKKLNRYPDEESPILVFISKPVQKEKEYIVK